MKLNLEKPLVLFDLETTGVNVAEDRIVQLGAIKVYPDGSKENYEQLINPGIPIPPETSKIHNIYDEDVRDKPLFSDIANELNAFLNGCDLAGYNSNKFDIPILAEEFLRSEISFSLHNRNAIDIQNIFHNMERRTLRAAYKFYTGKVLEGAHDAMVDIEATYEVLLKQIERYEGNNYHSEDEDCLTPITNDMDALAEYSRRGRFVDFAGRIVFNDINEEVFNFGKHKGKRVAEVFSSEPSYYNWMMRGEFPRYTKQIIQGIMLKVKQGG